MKTIDLETNEIKTFNLKKLYKKIRSEDKCKKKNFNIEGIAVTPQSVFIVNRDNNALYSYPINEFRTFLSDQVVPTPNVYHFTLPEINEIESTLSGIDYDPQKNALIFTASVEDKDDAISDGAIFGSFVGVIDLQNITTTPKTYLLEKDNQPLPIKAESIMKIKNDTYQVVTDSDGQGSQILTISLN